MISINFTGNTLHEVAGKAGQFAAVILASGLPLSASDPQAPPTATQAVHPLPLDGHDLVPTPDAVAAAKRTRRTKAEMEAARATEAHVRGATAEAIEAMAEATAATPAPAATETERAWGVGEVKAALMKVVEKDGLGPTAGGKLLAQFGVKRVSELEPKVFGGVIAACNAAVAA